MGHPFHPPGLPGTKDQIDSAERRVMAHGGDLLPGGLIVDGENARDPRNTNDADTLRAGLLLGKISASGRYGASILGSLSAAYDDSSGETTMTVSAATAAEIVRRIGTSGTFNVTGPPTAGGTVATEEVTFSAVDTGTGEITISAASADYIAGSLIQPTDGSEEPLTILARNRLVTDRDDNDINVYANAYIRGHVASDGIIDYPSDSSLKTWINSKLNGGDGTNPTRGNFTFAEDYAE